MRKTILVFCSLGFMALFLLGHKALAFTDPCVAGVCDTALGPIKTNPIEFITKLFGIILSLSGGIALLLIMFSGYRLMTSQGNAETIQGAKETLTSAIVGLLFIIFSFVILEVIGVDILHIPGFSH